MSHWNSALESRSLRKQKMKRFVLEAKQDLLHLREPVNTTTETAAAPSLLDQLCVVLLDFAAKGRIESNQ